MKFYGNGLVWDKEKDVLLCKFVNGEYETKEKHEQDALEKLGFEHEEVEVKQESESKEEHEQEEQSEKKESKKKPKK